jgi:hypothetical protein
LWNWTAGLADEHAHKLCRELVGQAPSLLVGQLIDRIKRLAIALDPEWAERQYEEALKDRRVESWQSPNGTANVAGRDLPAERAQAGSDRIDTLARSVKSAGDSRVMDAIRADLFLGMLDGQFAGMTDDEIVAYVLAHPIAGETSEGAPADEEAAGTRTHGTEHGRDAARSADGAEGGRDAARSADGKSTAADHERPAPVSAGTAWNARELRVELSTLLGIDQHPAELPGLGHVPASVARGMVPRMSSGQWRFVICGPLGTALCSGITPVRPAAFARMRRGARGNGIVELQLTAAQLATLREEVAGGRHLEWAGVITDIARRLSDGALDHIDSDHVDGDRDNEDVRRRFARAGLRRWVEVRDRYCLHPACRMPAARTDQDHRLDYAAGGPTIEQNLDSACRHDHRLIHEGGWATSRSGSGEIRWTSALGHTYVSRPPPVMMIYPDEDDRDAEPAA